MSYSIVTQFESRIYYRIELEPSIDLIAISKMDVVNIGIVLFDSIFEVKIKFYFLPNRH